MFIYSKLFWAYALRAELQRDYMQEYRYLSRCRDLPDAESVCAYYHRRRTGLHGETEALFSYLRQVL